MNQFLLGLFCVGNAVQHRIQQQEGSRHAGWDSLDNMMRRRLEDCIEEVGYITEDIILCPRRLSRSGVLPLEEEAA